MPTVSSRADLVVQSSDGDIVALVEVKNAEQLTPELTAAFRRNLVVHGALKWWTPFFLLVSQNVGFLWDQRGSIPPGALPSVEFSMRPIVRRYVPWLADGEWLREPQLNSVVTQWLSELAEGSGARVHDEALAQTGLLEMLKGGWIGVEVEL